MEGKKKDFHIYTVAMMSMRVVINIKNQTWTEHQPVHQKIVGLLKRKTATHSFNHA